MYIGDVSDTTVIPSSLGLSDSGQFRGLLVPYAFLSSALLRLSSKRVEGLGFLMLVHGYYG